MMIGDSDERNLDVDKITEKQNLLRTIDEALDRLKVKILMIIFVSKKITKIDSFLFHLLHLFDCRMIKKQ